VSYSTFYDPGGQITRGPRFPTTFLVDPRRGLRVPSSRIVSFSVERKLPPGILRAKLRTSSKMGHSRIHVRRPDALERRGGRFP